MRDFNIYQGSEIFYLSNKKLNPSKHDFPTIELDSIEQGTGKLLELYDSKGLRSQKNYFEAGQVLFGKLRPYLKKFARPKFSGLCSSEIWVVDTINKDILSQEYLFYLVQSSAFMEAAITMAGTKMPRSSWEVVSGFNYSLPSIIDQQKIVEILSDCDKAIELHSTTMEKEKKLFRKLLLETHDSFLINSDSSQICLKELILSQSIRGHQLPRSEYLKAGDTPIIDQSDDLISGYTNKKSISLSFPKGAVIFGDHTRIVKFFRGNFVAGADGTKVFLPVDTKMPVEYLYFLLTKAAENMPNLGYSRHFRELKNQRMRLVNTDGQLAIRSLLIDIWSHEQKQFQIFDLLKKQKRGLMQQLLTGKLKVKVAA